SMAIESVSNYEMKAVAVEKDKEAIKVIYENINSLQINNIDVFNMNALSFLKSKTGRIFDYIFVDTPYAEYDLLNECLRLIKTNNFLSTNGLI
ncbi:RsmD family RNA methyltransferase, partial [Mycoplasmopsis bovis]|uniref:RsmD family RNA methyltransferase n=1 Tax=Mycoplasmopsis bovis TaxID=28903 RepID=UPI003D26F5A0